MRNHSCSCCTLLRITFALAYGAGHYATFLWAPKYAECLLCHSAQRVDLSLAYVSGCILRRTHSGGGQWAPSAHELGAAPEARWPCNLRVWVS